MANVFDQFDAPQGTGNVYDQFGGGDYKAALTDQQAQQMSEMSGPQRFLAGAGHALKNLGMGSLQLDLATTPNFLIPNGLQDKLQSQVDEERRLSAPLMATPGGKAGDIAGNIAATLPVAMVPGVNTLPGAIAAGGMMGAEEPVGTGDSRALNSAKAAALFAAVPLATTAFRAGKALVQPLYQGGREAIVGQALDRFAGQDPNILSKLSNPETFVDGSLPTTADASGNASMAMLENAATSRDPLVKQAFAQRMAGNNAARVSALKVIAGAPEDMAAAVAARDSAAAPLYDAAQATSVPSDAQLSELLSRPSMKSAWARAMDLAQERGETLVSGVDAPASQATSGILDASGKPIMQDVPASQAQYSGKALHYLKLALDDMSNPNASAAIGRNEQGALMGTRDSLLNWMDENVPSYGQARATYAEKSAPINQMDVGQYLHDKLQPALNDFGGTTRNRAAQYADALRNADQTAAKATDFAGAKLADIMTPDQMNTLTGIAKDLSRRSATEDAMRGIGSNTAQNLASQNILSQIVGPLGLPQSFGQNALKNLMTVPYIGPAVKWGTQGAESAVQDELAKALLDPQRAAQLMQAAQKTNPGLALRLQRFMLAKQGGLLNSQ